MKYSIILINQSFVARPDYLFGGWLMIPSCGIGECCIDGFTEKFKGDKK
jgi:hypothetical protein